MSESPEKLLLRVRGASPTLVNAIRRAIIADLPCFAIDEVTFYENTSPLWDEWIAHRLGLIPLTFDASLGPGVEVTMRGEKSGPGLLKSGDLVSEDQRIRPVSSEFPIVELGEGQCVRFHAVARRGCARVHARWQCALASYSAWPSLRIGKACKRCMACVKACPRGLISQKLELLEPERCDGCNACAEACELGALELVLSESDYCFFVESFNNVSARDHLVRALELLWDRVSELAAALQLEKA